MTSLSLTSDTTADADEKATAERVRKIKESHDLARPMIHMDARHKLTQEFVALHEEVARAA